ncbi:MAG TPA: DUF4365 domain-containing protein [Pedobacter sp.]|jgi:hypothetical protein
MFNKEERIGVLSVGKIFVEEFCLIFHEQSVDDFGIDAFVEITKLVDWKTQEYHPTGRLIGIQIKSGNSFFNEHNSDHYVYRGSKRHLHYWLGHSIPVILILYDKNPKIAYWQEVSESTIVCTRKGFKVNIPKTNLLNRDSIDTFKKIGYFKNSYQFKLWNLRSSIDEIKSVIEVSHHLYVEIEDSYQRKGYRVRLFLTTEEDQFSATVFPECPGTDYFFYLSENMSLSDGIKEILPWLDLYYENKLFLDNHLATEVIEQSKEMGYWEFGENFSREYKEPVLKIACEMTGDYCFRLEPRPNELAFSFLKIDEYLNNDSKVEQRVFF